MELSISMNGRQLHPQSYGLLSWSTVEFSHLIMVLKALLLGVGLLQPAFAQSIYDSYTTTWDRTRLFTYANAGAAPVNFATPGAAGDAVINVADGTIYQQMDGFGAAITDSSAGLLNNMKSSASQNYWDLLWNLFDVREGVRSAAFSTIRVSIGASDFSPSAYSFDDVSGDTSLSQFNMDRAPSYLYSVLTDIFSVNPKIKLFVVPWSPPGWMKNTGTMKGGSLKSENAGIYANYLLKSVQGFRNKGFLPYAVSVQNEPGHSDGSYPTATMSADLYANVAGQLRTLLNNNGLSGVKILGYEHNWDNVAYPKELISRNAGAHAGAAFHCYGGNVAAQTDFRNTYPGEEVHFTECAGTFGSDWWGDIKWNMDNLIIGAVQNWARTVMFWNIALDGSGNPKLPGTGSCGGPGCRGVVTINGSSYSFNQEYYVLAQGSRAITPRDAGGPYGKRIGSSVSGGQGYALRVNAFVTERTVSTEWKRYSLVVLNWRDNDGGTWNPQPVRTTINFRGLQAPWTFPVGVTTLWWYAA